jgi:hypothetical protein
VSHFSTFQVKNKPSPESDTLKHKRPGVALASAPRLDKTHARDQTARHTNNTQG